MSCTPLPILFYVVLEKLVLNFGIYKGSNASNISHPLSLYLLWRYSPNPPAVSYTHLDVYKRQVYCIVDSLSPMTSSLYSLSVQSSYPNRHSFLPLLPIRCFSKSFNMQTSAPYARIIFTMIMYIVILMFFLIYICIIPLP